MNEFLLIYLGEGQGAHRTGAARLGCPGADLLSKIISYR
jgi:hypothetical protein